MDESFSRKVVSVAKDNEKTLLLFGVAYLRSNAARLALFWLEDEYECEDYPAFGRKSSGLSG